MPVLKTPPTYQHRSVKEWLKLAARGTVLLPNFQRSFVWKPPQTAHYLHALLENRPTGIFLVLQAEDPLPFECRRLHGSGTGFASADDSVMGDRELILDGQQRLTSLWGALTGAAPKRYLVGVNDLIGGDDEVKEVAWRSHSWSNPRKMCRENWVPTDVLWTGPSVSTGDARGAMKQQGPDITQWCREAVGDAWTDLYETVARLRERLVIAPRLQYCLLSKDTERDTAIDIFINVNRSAIKLKEVDIAVAIAAADHKVDLRQEIEGYLTRSTEVRHYFNRAPQKAISEVAEWMLKVGCLKVGDNPYPDGLPPSATHYPSSVKHLCGPGGVGATGNGSGEGGKAAAVRLRQMEDDLDAALRFVAVRGGATKRTLASWPPVHVVAALQEDVRQAGSALERETERLLSAYVWRSFVTERYSKLANARLLEDFRALREYLRGLAAWKASGGAKPKLSAPVFDSHEYSIPGIPQLRRAGWIGTGSRLGKAIAAVAMQGKTLDWVTGEPLDPARIRDLEVSGRLERRHVFPPALFEADVGRDITVGLNGVLLPKGSFEPCDPADLTATITRQQPDLDPLELGARVESHRVRWVTLARDGAAPSFRYDRYLEERARVLATRIAELTTY